MSTRLYTIAFWRSAGMLNLFRPREADEARASLTRVLLLTISIATTHNFARAQSSAQRETLPPSSITVQEGSGDNQSTSSQRRSSNPQATHPCTLRVPDTIPQYPAKEATTTSGSFVYTPLSARCKFDLFLKQTYSPYTFVSAGFQATWAQAMGQWPHYGGGTQGWAKRLGATLADTESRRFIQGFALSTILHQDPRYFPSRKRTLISRVWYSTTRVVVTRNDKGDSTFNTSEVLGALFASSLQNAYYPRHDRNFGDTMNRFSGALSSDAIGYLLREFTPDMKRLFRKHAPKKILRIEEKLPIPPEDKP
jgi:hypothetical protein